jgi:hypothetical protein
MLGYKTKMIQLRYAPLADGDEHGNKPLEGGNSEVCKWLLTHCGRVTKISVFNTVKLGTSASSS